MIIPDALIINRIKMWGDKDEKKQFIHVCY